MEFQIAEQIYKIQNPETLRTPRLIIFQDRVEENIRRMRGLLESMVPGSGFRTLCAHVKTHKSSRVTRMLLDAGVASFKTTLNELRMLLECGCKDVFVAYPLLESGARMIADCMKRFPESRISVQIGSKVHAEILRRTAAEQGVRWTFFLDMDVGMHRTGTGIQEAFGWIDSAASGSEFEFAGIHGYDGHNHHVERNLREEESRRSMGAILEAVQGFQDRGVRVDRVVVGGSPSFMDDLKNLGQELPSSVHLQVSPGTWIYWDSGYDRILPGWFQFGALILAQVMDMPQGRITLNLGHKRWGADQGPVECFSHPGLRIVSYSEEHTVLERVGGPLLQIGDFILIVPRHVCSTVNLYEHAAWVDAEGRILSAHESVDSRNR